MWHETHAKVNLELGLLHRLVDSHRSLLTKARTVEPDAIEISALSAYLHSFYTGIENIFKRIALEIDESLPGGGRSHADLLSQMTQPSPSRAAVISQDICSELGKYMEFRHVFRHAYTFDLRWAKMADLVLRSEQTLGQLKMEFAAFFEAKGQ